MTADCAARARRLIELEKEIHATSGWIDSNANVAFHLLATSKVIAELATWALARDAGATLAEKQAVTMHESWRLCTVEFNAAIARAEAAEAENAKLREALERVVADILDYERVNNLSPNPGRQYCWDSVAHARDLLTAAQERKP